MEASSANTLVRSLRKARDFMTQHWAVIASACLLVLMGVNLLTTSARKSVTCDELVHIPVGYYHLRTGDFRLNPEHPPLSKFLAALPLIFVRPYSPPLRPAGDQSFEAITLDYAPRFWEVNKADSARIVFWSRVPMIALTLLLGTLIFVYARQLFGAQAAVFATALFTLEPTILAHGRIVHSDVPAALGYLLFFYTLHRYFLASTKRRALLLGIVSGLALLTKFSLLVMLPVLLFAVVFLFVTASQRNQNRRELLLHSGIIILVALVVVNAAYGFQRPVLQPADQQWLATWAPARAHQFVTSITVLSRIVPTYFVLGACAVSTHNSYGHPAFLLGEYRTTGWWFYFPVAFALKTTLPFLLLTVASLGWAIWRLFKRERKFLALLLPLAVFIALAISSRINIGIRHFLPAFPFFFILGGAFLSWLLSLRARRVARLIVVLLLCWTTVEAVRAYPDYLAYMNELTSRRPRWYYLSDSNIEWGDDIGELARYLRARGETNVRGSMSGAWMSLSLYGVKYWAIPTPPDSPTPRTRYVAIGAGVLNGSTVVPEQRAFFAQYRHRTPEAIFGNSIYLYREEGN